MKVSRLGIHIHRENLPNTPNVSNDGNLYKSSIRNTSTKFLLMRPSTGTLNGMLKNWVTSQDYRMRRENKKLAERKREGGKGHWERHFPFPFPLKVSLLFRPLLSVWQRSHDEIRSQKAISQICVERLIDVVWCISLRHASSWLMLSIPISPSDVPKRFVKLPLEISSRQDFVVRN